MTKSIVQRLASSLNRRDEQPNIELAVELAQSGDPQPLDELFNITNCASKPLRHDALKTLYETALRNPQMLLAYKQQFVDLLSSSDNRMIWGTIQALDVLTRLAPDFIVSKLDLILDAADRSSVVAKDKTMSILSKLNDFQKFSEQITPIFLMRLKHSAPNQFPMYAELAAATMPETAVSQLIQIIKERQKSIASPAKQKRLNKILQKLH